MGFGVNLALIAIGAILAFATRFTLSGIDLRMVGLIVMVAGAAGLVITAAYLRPRRMRAGQAGPDLADTAPAARWYGRRRARSGQVVRLDDRLDP